MDQRIEFAIKSLGAVNFRQLCREYGISAKTGYKWQDRFVERGAGGMADLSRRPHRHPLQLSGDVVCDIVRIKQAHPTWGPRKVAVLYARHHQGQAPSESSFKRVLERAGMTLPRRVRRSRDTGRLATGIKARQPNDVWTVDFKGWWKDRHGWRVEPLTVRDEYSRMLLDMRLLANNRGQSVRRCFERLFERYGLPGVIRSDNGSPFASSSALLGLSKLSAWWLALGIDLERNRPGCPQDNGGHERMHRDVRQELQAGRVGRDQDAFDLWRDEYNRERPHEAIGMKTPAELYRKSQRRFEGTPDDLDYGGADRRLVSRTNGCIQYQGQLIFLSTALAGWSVGLKPRRDGLIEIWFSKLLLGHLDPRTFGFQPARTGRLEAEQPKEQKEV